MTEICVVGSGIVGKYLAHHLAGRDVLWISGHNQQYHSSGEYKIENYLGVNDTWQEKATGIFSFPTRQDRDIFPFSWNKYQIYEQELKEELALKSLSSLISQPAYKEFVATLQSIFPGAMTQFFHCAHHEITGPTFMERLAYDQYWRFQKPMWRFSSDDSQFLQAQYFIIEKGEAKKLVCTDEHGREKIVAAKQFVLACHTPSTIALLARTCVMNKLRAHKLIGRYFSDHAQTSFGLLLPGTIVPRTTLPGFCYQDRSYQDIPYRLEFHIAPPREELIKRTRMRLPQYATLDFEQCFLRVALIYQFPKLAHSRLQVSGKSADKASLNAVFLNTLRQQRRVLLPYLQKHFFQDERVVLLNQHFPFFFAGHLAGGAVFPEVVDEQLRVHFMKNVAIAGQATLSSTGLFNPTFAALITAKHVLQSY